MGEWEVRLYLGIDDDDRFWLQNAKRLVSPEWLGVNPKFYHVSKTDENRVVRVPFNELARDAFDDGAEYFVRINDDTEFMTSGWITVGVRALLSFSPPNLGVVGPQCTPMPIPGQGPKLHVTTGPLGNPTACKILTHDMTHRTHLEVFEHYYPKELSNQWVDDWITKVYVSCTQKYPTLKCRSKQLQDWEVKHHTGFHGTRYRVNRLEGSTLQQMIRNGTHRIRGWVERREENNVIQTLQEKLGEITSRYQAEQKKSEQLRIELDRLRAAQHKI